MCDKEEYTGREQHCDDNVDSLWDLAEESGCASEASSCSLETSARDEHLIRCLPCRSCVINERRILISS